MITLLRSTLPFETLNTFTKLILSQTIVRIRVVLVRVLLHRFIFRSLLSLSSIDYKSASWVEFISTIWRRNNSLLTLRSSRVLVLALFGEKTRSYYLWASSTNFSQNSYIWDILLFWVNWMFLCICTAEPIDTPLELEIASASVAITD